MMDDSRASGSAGSSHLTVYDDFDQPSTSNGGLATRNREILEALDLGTATEPEDTNEGPLSDTTKYMNDQIIASQSQQPQKPKKKGWLGSWWNSEKTKKKTSRFEEENGDETTFDQVLDIAPDWVDVGDEVGSYPHGSRM
jgi:hypothetical protein